MDKSLSELLRAALATLGGRISAAALGLIVSVIVARAYGANMIGFLALVNSIAMLSSIPAKMGFGVSIMRFIPEYKINLPQRAALRLFNHVVIITLVSSVFVAVILSFLKVYWVDLLPQEFDMLNFEVILGLAIVSNVILTICTVSMRAFNFNRVFIIFQFLPALINLLCLLFLMQLFKSLAPVYAFIIAIFVSSILAFTIVNYLESKTLQGPSGEACHDIRLTKILSISIPMMFTGMAAVLASEYGVIYLGSVTSLAEVGLYATGLRFAMMTGMGLKALNSVAGPKVSGLYFSGQIKEMFVVARFISAISAGVALMTCLFFVLFGETMIVLLFGADFEGSYPVLMVLMVSQVINAAAGPTGLVLNMAGHEKKCTLITFIASVSLIMTSFLLVPELGAIGLALGVLVFEIVWNGLGLLTLYSEYNQHTIFRASELRAFYNKLKRS